MLRDTTSRGLSQCTFESGHLTLVSGRGAGAREGDSDRGSEVVSKSVGPRWARTGISQKKVTGNFQDAHADGSCGGDLSGSGRLCAIAHRTEQRSLSAVHVGGMPQPEFHAHPGPAFHDLQSVWKGKMCREVYVRVWV